MKALLMIALACLAACKDKKEGQTFRQAMELICNAADQPDVQSAHPADKARLMSEWVDQRLTNAEARKLFEEVGSANPAEVSKILDDAAERAGLDGCALTRLSPVDPLASLALPEVGAVPLDPIPDQPVFVIATADAIVVEGDAVLPLRDHEIDLAELEGGRGGHLIPRLRRYLEAIPSKSSGVAIAVHPKTPYRVLFAMIASSRPPMPAVWLVARDGTRHGVVPLTIPDTDAPTPSLGMVVALTTTKTIVFSFDGSEGTLGKPLIEVPTADGPAKVQAALVEVAARHPGERRAVLMADDGVAAQEVVTMIATMRKSFPEVLLSRGFE